MIMAKIKRKYAVSGWVIGAFFMGHWYGHWVGYDAGADYVKSHTAVEIVSSVLPNSDKGPVQAIYDGYWQTIGSVARFYGRCLELTRDKTSQVRVCAHEAKPDWGE